MTLTEQRILHVAKSWEFELRHPSTPAARIRIECALLDAVQADREAREEAWQHDGCGP
jgi:hypothetical protein